MRLQNLDAANIGLAGKHLIEASAGTGKTYNITRIYLRLLVERGLSVEQILVMTFTKDATEELRGRIEAFLRQAIQEWPQLVATDSYFKQINTRVGQQEAILRLKKALLYLDEAAIYTIHGFCKRVLSQHAFASGVAFNVQMEADCQDLLLEACQDWYRVLGQQSVSEFMLLAEFWPVPESFLSHFSKAINYQHSVALVTVAEVIDSFHHLVRRAYQDLTQAQDQLDSYLIAVKKPAEQLVRQQELQALLAWLQQVEAATVQSDDFDVNNLTVMPDAFLDGRRYGRSKFKADIIVIFASANEVKSQIKKLAKSIARAQALDIARRGIYHIRGDLMAKKQQLGLLNFDDLITTLASALSLEKDPQGRFSDTLFNQYPVALVDEFQDTDPQQFAILQAIYYRQMQAALYMIGDPKQAIYGFRGGDVFAYLSARDACDHQWLMETNWRSTALMIQGYNRLFYGNPLSEAPKDVFGYAIPYLPVNAPDNGLDKPCLLTGDSDRKPLQFIHFTTVDPKTEQAATQVKQSFRPVIADWCAEEIVALLTPASTADVSLKAKDIAILVRDGTEALLIKQALNSRGLASVFLSNRANLLHSEQTIQLIAVLKGILFLENDRLYTAALASGLLGYYPEKLYQLQQDDLAWQALKFTFSQLRDEWLYKGFIGMALQLMHQQINLPKQDKDRALTNLLHLFEILQSASQRHRQPQELLYWFEQQASLDNPETQAELRLESDADLLRIITQHGSKGLEYPVVFIPFATRHKDPLRFGNRAISFIEYHDKQGQLQLSLDGSAVAKQAMAAEAYAETIRLLYVAVTRAEQRCYICTTAFDRYQQSPLGLTLQWSAEQDMLTSLTGLAQECPNAIAVEHISQAPTDISLYQQEIVAFTPEVAKFTGRIERDWWLSSFSALSKNLRHGGISTPDRDNQSIDLGADGQLISAQLRFTLAKGAHSGNLLHDILEHTDFEQPNWQQSMKDPLLKYGALPLGYCQQDLQTWLKQILESPLVQADCCLADISLAKSLRESEFYFPMASANSKQLADLVTQHRQAQLTEYSTNTELTLPAYQELKGMMHGFIDLVFEHEGKFYVCDYKSTYLGDSFSDYQKDKLQENIEKNYYDLQYLIYALALHRHLRHALPDYQPELHFGGIYYFYLRGMSQLPENQEAGVYYRAITPVELTQLDTLFASGQSKTNDNEKGNNS